TVPKRHVARSPCAFKRCEPLARDEAAISGHGENPSAAFNHRHNQLFGYWTRFTPVNNLSFPRSSHKGTISISPIDLNRKAGGKRCRENKEGMPFISLTIRYVGRHLSQVP